MRFGIILPSYINSDTRHSFAERSYESLLRTLVPVEDQPLLLFVVAAGERAFNTSVVLKQDTRPFFDTKLFSQTDGVAGLDPAIAWVVENLFAETD
jgi:hypothetical protein